MNKLEMMKALLPDLTAEEIEVRIDQMEDILDVIIKEDFLTDSSKVLYGQAVIRIKELFVELLDAIGESDNEKGKSEQGLEP